MLTLAQTRSGPRRHPLTRVRYQLLGGLSFAILLPALIRLPGRPELIFDRNLQMTILAAVVAHVLGFFVYRRMGAFPGIAAASYILPTFLLTYGTVFLVIFFFRIDYSRFQAASSFMLSTSWYFGLNVAARRLVRYSLAVIPVGDVARLSAIPGVAWRLLAAPGQLVDDISGVVADLRADFSDEWERFIADCALSGTPVYHVKQITESLTGRVLIEQLSENTLGSLNPNDTYLKIKQALDWLGALLLILACSPLMLAAAIAVRVDSPGPVLFRQSRIGYRGQAFTVFKFRSMRHGADGGDARESAITRPGDERITRVGRILRRSRLDELPQLFNILRGEMSFIGPRPEAEVLAKWYQGELPFYRYRHIVRPGISGWAQVNQGHVAAVDDVLDKLHYDFYYIKNFSPWLDVVIVFRTIMTMLTGFGAR